MNAVPVITVDGPSGSGKGTVSKRLTRQLGWHFLDSGALYRLAALAASRRRLDPNDPGAVDAIVALAAALHADFHAEEDGREVILLDGADVTQVVRSEDIANQASQVAVLQPVRQALLAVQHDFRRAPGLVADGRDMGTVVFPDAPLKLFLIASADERAKRRFKQLKELGIGANLQRILTEIQRRDRRDQAREHSPLMPAADAVVVDTTDLSVDDVVARAMQFVALRGLSSL